MNFTIWGNFKKNFLGMFCCMSIAFLLKRLRRKKKGMPKELREERSWKQRERKERKKRQGLVEEERKVKIRELMKVLKKVIGWTLIIDCYLNFIHNVWKEASERPK